MGYAARRALAAELHWTAVLVVLFSVGMYYRGFGLDASFTLEELVDLSLYPIDDLASAAGSSRRRGPTCARRGARRFRRS